MLLGGYMGVPWYMSGRDNRVIAPFGFQEGRMRGQAFVTFPSVELAHHALVCVYTNETGYANSIFQNMSNCDVLYFVVNVVNGYVFKGKPMIIQFGRNPAAAKEK
ncbi:U11/U12 small nuclear ribonucleoprotein 65 kDa protein [Vitis vinifera]|uniref:U11/U12 small nuclear ribonucleoprotein 65 kDa protein n=1 Tax=Vitis vinifera TaxID=29760 RepID=A0A438DK72_VITVI|nr:U11/U12 small nuclear ribonucleoprotein 65 kDa protein [Vitis vinifera]